MRARDSRSATIYTCAAGPREHGCERKPGTSTTENTRRTIGLYIRGKAEHQPVSGSGRGLIRRTIGIRAYRTVTTAIRDCSRHDGGLQATKGKERMMAHHDGASEARDRRLRTSAEAKNECPMEQTATVTAQPAGGLPSFRPPSPISRPFALRLQRHRYPL